MNRGRRLAFLLLTLAIAAVLAAAVAEASLRALAPRRGFFPFAPGTVRAFFPSEDVTPGVTGTSRFDANSLGCRGPEYAGERWKLVTLGGSTTACTALDNTETWPELVRRGVCAPPGAERRLWVTNAAVDGHNTFHHLAHARYLVPRLPKVDFVLIYCGLNDMGVWLLEPERALRSIDAPGEWERAAARSFKVCEIADPDASLLERSEVFQRLHAIELLFRSRRAEAQIARAALEQDERGEWMRQAQRRRREAPKLALTPERRAALPAALEAYGARVRRLVTLVREAGAEPIFMAQAMRASGVTAEERDRLWMGLMSGGTSYIDEAESQRLVEEFNRRAREVCLETKTTYLDLPAALEGRAGVFFDGCHFTEKGARVVADFVAAALAPMLDARERGAPR